MATTEPGRAINPEGDWTAGPARIAAVVALGLAVAFAGAASIGRVRPVRAEPGAVGVGAVRLDLNGASADELELLPGIGPSLARRIVEDRARRGSFATVDDLGRIKGIGPRTLERLRPFLRVEGDASGD